MKEINLANVLVKKRREKGITQEELAAFIGVSKASVSKWETGQSYPDVTFLPQLASYFGISLDELMDYRPQLAKEDIKKLYIKLSEDFTSKPFYEVLEKCRGIIKKYFSCYPLIVQMGLLILNHVNLAESPGEASELILEVKGLFLRARQECEDVELLKKATYLEALCCISSGDPNGTFELLGEKAEQALPPEALLASAYRMLGRCEDAKAVLQAGIFQNIVVLFNFFPALLLLNTDNPSKFAEILKRSFAVAEAFDLRRLHPGIMASFHLTAAQAYMIMGSKEKALELLEIYADTVTGNIYPLKLHGDSFFDLLDAWLEDLDLGDSLPRNEKTIRKSMSEAVAQNPLFSELYGMPRFEMIIDKLKISC